MAEVRSNGVEQRRRVVRSVQALLRLLLLGLLASCGSSAAATNTTAPTPTAPAPIKDNETPTATASTGWATYTNTAYGYIIEYPTGWFALDTSPTSGDFNVFSYDSSKVSGLPLPSGATKVEILIYPNPTQTSLTDVLQQTLDQRTQRGEPVGTITKRSVTMAGQPSLEVIEGPHGGNVFGGYTITYMIPHGAIMLWLMQPGLPSGAPSATLTQIVQSLTLTGP